ncbi:ribonuclease III domain-containing protein [Cyathus striatus]|nr:ribonuclease III domain-containing protein [Cyathus striatus]
MTILPPLPRIEGNTDLLLDVFTHKSLRFDGAPLNDDYGDTERLAEMGAKVVELAVTFHFYSIKPHLTADIIARRKQDILSAETLNSWLEAYGLKAKLRCAPGHELDKPEEIHRFFNTYVGALYITSGLPSIQSWLSRLIDPEVDVSMPDLPPSYGSSAPPPPGPAPPVPSPPLSNPSSSSGVDGLALPMITLALVNQTAAQKGFIISYPASQTGPPHQPVWTVKCCLNGQERGSGTGKSQKAAREEAAKQAWVAMGWSLRT